jgi:Lrp/AsnC family transcriptional regulator for asnA, asnC and gidA
VTPLPQLDDVDRHLIELLSVNGRASNVALARELGLTEATVRKRLERLFSAGVVRVIAVTDPAVLGYTVDAVIGLNVVPGRQTDVARKLAALPNVRYMAHAAGRFNVICEGVFRGPQDLQAFLGEVLGDLDGVTAYEVFYVLGMEKVGFAGYPGDKAD